MKDRLISRFLGPGLFSIDEKYAKEIPRSDNSQPMTGDGTIVARVASVQNTSAWAKAGVMMRDALTPGGANVAAFVTPGEGVSSQWRATDRGATNYVTKTGLVAPYWVEVVRAANVFTTYYSPDGLNWTQQTSQTISMSSTIYVGLAVTAHDNSALCNATFDHVKILPSATWSAMDIGSSSVPGFTSWSDGVLKMNASGSAIGAYNDQFRYLYQPPAADKCDRQHLPRCCQQPQPHAPLLGRAPRSGNYFTAFTSQDGINWITVGSTTLPMGASTYVGIPLTSHNATVLGAAIFSNISVSP